MVNTDDWAKERLNVPKRTVLTRRLGQWLATIAGVVGLGCGASNEPSHAEGKHAAGAGGMTAASLGSLGGAAHSQTSSTTVGGAPNSRTVGATTNLQDPEGDIPCEAEPDDGTWSEISFDAGLLWQLALAQHRAILTSVDEDRFLARVSDDSGKSWSDAIRINTDESPVDALDTQVIVAPDGSSAFAYWQSTGASRWVNRYDSAHGWSGPVQVAEGRNGDSVELFTDHQLVVLSNAKAVLAHKSGSNTSGIEYHLFDGSSWGPTESFRSGQFAAVFLGQNEVPTLYTEEADPIQISPARRTLDFATGWSAPEFIPYRAKTGAHQLSAFDGLHGHAARIRRGLDSEGIQISVREDGIWQPDESLGDGPRNLLDRPSVSAAGDELLAGWSKPTPGTSDESDLFFASRTTAMWQSVTIARARNLAEVSLVGSQTGAAMLTGTLDHFPEPSLAKVFRRGRNGTWYCPHTQTSS